MFERVSAEDQGDQGDQGDQVDTAEDQPETGAEKDADFDSGLDGGSASGSNDGEDVISIDPDNLPSPDSSDPSDTSDTTASGSRLDKLLRDYRLLQLQLDDAIKGGLVDKVRDLRVELEGYEEYIFEAGGTQAQIDAILSEFDSSGLDVSTGDQGRGTGSMSSEDFRKLEREFSVTYTQYMDSVKKNGPNNERTQELFQKYVELKKKVDAARAAGE